MVKIASTFFDEVRTQRPLFVPINPGYSNIFSLPAVELGASPAILEVHDFHQYDSDDGKGNRVMRTITAREIAADIMIGWLEDDPDMNPDCGPGIWLVNEDTWALDKDNADARNRAYAEVLILKGDVMHADPARRGWIPERCRKAAGWMGVERDWVKGLKGSAIKTCAYCTQSIPATAVICPKCQQVVDFAKHAELKAKEQAAIAALAKPAPLQAPVKQQQQQQQPRA